MGKRSGRFGLLGRLDRWATGPVLLFLLLSPLHSHAIAANSICQTQGGSTSIPDALCTLPQCEKGPDCATPTVTLGSAGLAFDEPTMQWSEGSCPQFGLKGCWRVRFRFHLTLGAQSPVGVQDIGVQMKTEVQNRTTHIETFYGPAEQADAKGPYTMSNDYTELVPPEGKVILNAISLCVRDAAGTEMCAAPQKPIEKKLAELPKSPR